jgi:hypothetical protein
MTPTPPAPHPPHTTNTPRPVTSADPTLSVHRAPPLAAPPVSSHCISFCKTTASTATQTAKPRDCPEIPTLCTSWSTIPPPQLKPLSAAHPLPTPRCAGVAADPDQPLHQYRFALSLIQEGNKTKASLWLLRRSHSLPQRPLRHPTPTNPFYQ